MLGTPLTTGFIIRLNHRMEWEIREAKGMCLEPAHPLDISAQMEPQCGPSQDLALTGKTWHILCTGRGWRAGQNVAIRRKAGWIWTWMHLSTSPYWMGRGGGRNGGNPYAAPSSTKLQPVQESGIQTRHSRSIWRSVYQGEMFYAICKCRGGPICHWASLIKPREFSKPVSSLEKEVISVLQQPILYEEQTRSCLKIFKKWNICILLFPTCHPPCFSKWEACPGANRRAAAALRNFPAGWGFAPYFNFSVC